MPSPSRLDDLLRVLGSHSQADASRFQALMAARRTMQVAPWDQAAVDAGRLDSLHLRAKQLYPDYEGMYFDGGVAVYPRGDRATRRHEVMHGMVDRAQDNPLLQDALPIWARGARPGGFRDELLARLASQDRGQLIDWPLGRYAMESPQSAWAYRVAMPVQYAARVMERNPLAPASLLGTLGGMAAASAVGSADQ